MLLTEAHNILSQHTRSVGTAAAELFRQCERMLSEFRDQITSVKELGFRVDNVVDEDRQGGSDGGKERGKGTVEEGGDEEGEGEDGDEGAAEKEEEEGGRRKGVGDEGEREEERKKSGGEQGVQRRIETARQKNEELIKRYEALQRKEAILSARVVSEKEERWRRELDGLKWNVLGSDGDGEGGDGGEGVDDGDDGDDGDGERNTIRRRFDEVRSRNSFLPA